MIGAGGAPAGNWKNNGPRRKNTGGTHFDAPGSIGILRPAEPARTHAGPTTIPLAPNHPRGGIAAGRRGGSTARRRRAPAVIWPISSFTVDLSANW